MILNYIKARATWACRWLLTLCPAQDCRAGRCCCSTLCSHGIPQSSVSVHGCWFCMLPESPLCISTPLSGTEESRTDTSLSTWNQMQHLHLEPIERQEHFGSGVQLSGRILSRPSQCPAFHSHTHTKEKRKKNSDLSKSHMSSVNRKLHWETQLPVNFMNLLWYYPIWVLGPMVPCFLCNWPKF